MKKSIKAALFSGLLFPGTGHLLLRQWLVGAIIFSASFISLGTIIYEAMQIILDLNEQMSNGLIDPYHFDIQGYIYKTMARPEMINANYAENILVLLWFIGIADAYRIGRKIDSAQGNQQI